MEKLYEVLTMQQALRWLQSSGLVLSAIGSGVLARLSLRAPDTLRRLVRPTWNDFGGSPEEVDRAVGEQKWTVVGLLSLGTGLGLQVFRFYLATDFSLLGLLWTAGSVAFVLAVSYWHGWLAGERVREALEEGAGNG